MKRKRKHHADLRSVKRAKISGSPLDSPTWSLIRHHYSNVSSLRQYLAAKLSRTSKKRCRTILRYGQSAKSDDAANGDEALVRLLDHTVVGSFDGTESIDLDAIERDITVFTQQLSDSTTTFSPTQGVLKQSEVGIV